MLTATSPPGARCLDNLTHALVGAAIGKAGADRTTPLAMSTLVVAANAPDVDVLSYLGGPFFALAFRRGITHGWPALVALPFAVAGLMLGWDRWIRRRRVPSGDPARAGPVLVLAALGVLTHPTLDWMNMYGMRWGLPFDGGWSYGDALFIVDPWIWLALGGSVFLTSRPGRSGVVAWSLLAAFATALVVAAAPRAGVGWVAVLALVVVLSASRRSTCPRSGRRLVRVAVAGTSLYVGGLVVLDGVAVADVRRAAEDAGIDVEEVMVAPTRGNPLASDVVLATGNAYVAGSHRWIGSPRVRLSPTESVPLVDGPATLTTDRAEEIVALARREADVRHYLVWSRYPYFRVERAATGWMVTVSDARYDGAAAFGSLSGLTVQVGDGGS